MTNKRAAIEDFIDTLPDLLTNEAKHSSQIYGVANEWSPFESDSLSVAALMFYAISFVLIQPITQKVMSAELHRRVADQFNRKLLLELELTQLSSLQKDDSFEMLTRYAVGFKKNLDVCMKEGIVGRDAYLKVATESFSSVFGTKKSQPKDMVIVRHIDRGISIYQNALKL